ncbi:MAG TPA: SDR family oxidoreductase [Acidimicrobiales bacterium]|nr:SDR family oxidoreductase [Acidimicrobiales bacterium]
MSRVTQREESTAELQLRDQWAVVTGASKGIGLGIARAFVDAGAHVAVVARTVDVLHEAADELRGRAHVGQMILPMAADTGDPDAIGRLFDGLRAELPRLNVFVANAGSGAVTPFLDLSLEEWDRTVALNLTGTFLCCQQAARMMRPLDGENRAILVISSIRAIGARPGRLVYSATKAAVNQLVRVAAQELAPFGIRVNTLSPGITATPLALEGNPEVFAEAEATVPLGRAGTPNDMAAGALYLCSPSAAFVTGANLVVDGGESLY